MMNGGFALKFSLQWLYVMMKFTLSAAFLLIILLLVINFIDFESVFSCSPWTHHMFLSLCTCGAAALSSGCSASVQLWTSSSSSYFLSFPFIPLLPELLSLSYPSLPVLLFSLFLSFILPVFCPSHFSSLVPSFLSCTFHLALASLHSWLCCCEASDSEASAACD